MGLTSYLHIINVHSTWLAGKPMYLMEVALGQFSQLGPLEVWKNMSPIGRGVGFAMCTISLIVAIYYNGSFQLEFESISQVINHMTCYKLECSHLQDFLFSRNVVEH